MIEIARLRDKEFSDLEHFADGIVPDRQKSIAIIARNDAGIIGRIFLVAPAHLEGIFIEPAWRNGTVFKRLVDAVEIEARAEGIRRLYAYATNEEMKDYIERSGFQVLPWSVLVKELP